MEFPKTDTALKEAGYKYEGPGKCRSTNCGAEISWWRTPKGKMIPLDEGTMEVHWSTCPDAKDFRK